MIFYLTAQHTTQYVRIVMKHNTPNGRADSGADFLTLCCETLAVLLILACGALLLAL